MLGPSFMTNFKGGHFMKKLYVKLVALFLPIALYIGMFVVFEPYNYFGLKESTTTDKDDDSIIGRILAFNEQQPESLILGDSRMAHFDLDYITELTGEEYGTLAFGGAAMNETIDLFWYAVEKDPNLKRVVIGVSFYHLNKGYYKNRMSQIEELLSNPLAYTFNFNYNVEMLNNLRYALTGVETGANSEEGIWPDADYYYDDGTPRPYRKNLEEYALENIYAVCKEYTLDEDDLANLLKIADYCNKNGIELIFVLPPVDVSIGDLVIEPLGIDAQMAYYIPLLEQNARVLNYEYPIYYTDQDLFYDGFHLDPVRGLPGFTQQLFAVDIPNLEESTNGA